ncbi:MAG TPA: hypothetical protein DGG95_16065 [Cytophagales bacterium]|nr:hypothetical protein [Cytophagales bacterium]
MKKLLILVTCEESQAVTKAFRALGHEAYSNDIIECSGGHPEWHLQMDALKALKLKKWDLIIAFPPCTYLTISANKWYKDQPARKSGALVGEARRQARREAIKFFMEFVNADCEHIAIENPVGIMSTKWRKPNQIVQPYQFGQPESKKTCLWLKGLPNLIHTNVLPKPACGYWANQTSDGQNKVLVDGKWIAYNDPRTASLRSKTYKGIAEAMAWQWSEYLS